MFEVNNNIAKINGANGKYDENKVKDPSIRYGRNAVDNFYSYVENPIINDPMNVPPILDLGTSHNAVENNIELMDKYVKENDAYLNSLPPLEFEYRYMPNIQHGKVDKKAVLGAAYEEMGKQKEVEVNEMDRRFGFNDQYTTSPIDVNGDGKIDNAEYATTILAADMLSKAETPDTNNIDGTVNNKGMNKVLAYTQKSNAQAAAALYSNIYNKYNLGAEVKDFNPEA